MALFSEMTKQLKPKKAAGKAGGKSKGKAADKSGKATKIGGTASKIASYKQEKVITAFKLVALADIVPDPTQPRKVVDTKSPDLRAMAETIKDKGVLEPLLVQKDGETYRLIAGERRYWSSTLAGLKEVPVRVVSYSEREIAEVQLIENIQRKDLNPLERARGLKNIIDKSDGSAEEAYKGVGISRSLYYALMSLLNLPESMQLAIDASYEGDGDGLALRELIELAKIKDSGALHIAFDGLVGGDSLIEKRQSANKEKSKKSAKSNIQSNKSAKNEGNGDSQSDLSANNMQVVAKVKTKSGVEVLVRVPKGFETDNIDVESLDAAWQDVLNKI